MSCSISTNSRSSSNLGSMRVKIFFITMCIGSHTLAQADFLKSWDQKIHVVERGETLRLIARKYFGVKYGVFCLKDQLGLENPNNLEVGQKLEFVAPTTTNDELALFMDADLKCSKNFIQVNDQVVYPTEGMAPSPKRDEGNDSGWDDMETSELESEAPAESEVVKEEAPEKLEKELKEVAKQEHSDFEKLEISEGSGPSSRLTLGSGINFSHFKEEVSGGQGGVTYNSLAFADLHLIGKLNLFWNLAIDFEYLVTPFEVPVAADKSVFKSSGWSQSAVGISANIPAFEFHFGNSIKFHTLFRAGHEWSKSPYLTIVSSSYEFHEVSYKSAYLGPEFHGFLGENWWSIFRFSYVMPYETISSTMAIQGGLEVYRRIFNEWWAGMSWHGRLLNSSFRKSISSLDLEIKNEMFHSSLNLNLQKSF